LLRMGLSTSGSWLGNGPAGQLFHGARRSLHRIAPNDGSGVRRGRTFLIPPPAKRWGGWPAEGRSGGGCLRNGTLRALPCATRSRHIARLPTDLPVKPLGEKYSDFPKTQITLYPPPS
jgi:hypothetical protein